jgi:hypothetical protein
MRLSMREIFFLGHLFSFQEKTKGMSENYTEEFTRENF